MTTKPQFTTTKLEGSEPTLEPCPFCGGEAFLTEDDVSQYPADGKVWHVTCLDSCSVAPGIYAQQTKEEAIGKWNSRAAKTQVELLCDEHRKAFTVFYVGGCIKCWQENECASRVRVSDNGDPTVDADLLRLVEDLASFPFDVLMDENATRMAITVSVSTLRHMQARARQIIAAASPVAPQQSDATKDALQDKYEEGWHDAIAAIKTFGLEQVEAMENAAPAPSATIQDETELAKLRQAIGWICDAADAAYIEDSDNVRIHEIFNIAAQAAGLTRRLPDEYQRFDESGSD